MSEWIKCSDRLPTVGQHCLIWIPVCGHGEIEGAVYDGDESWIAAWCSRKGAEHTYKVRYWMPAPAEPHD